MIDTGSPKITLASVHGLAKHLHAMSMLKSRYEISNEALNSVHPSLVIYNTNWQRRRTCNQFSLKHRYLFQRPEIQANKININALSCPQRLIFFPRESILRFINQSQHGKLFASWH